MLRTPAFFRNHNHADSWAITNRLVRQPESERAAASHRRSVEFDLAFRQGRTDRKANRLLLVLLVLLPFAHSVAYAQSAPLIPKQGQIVQPAPTDTLTLTGSPAFSDSSYAGRFQSLLNGANPGTLYTSQQVGHQSTDAIAGAISVPVGASAHQTNAIAAYIISNRAQPGNGGDVGGYFQVGCNANNCAGFGLNPMVYDKAGKNGQTLGNEFDFNRNAVDTTVNGINLVLNSAGSPTGFANGFACRTSFRTGKWNNCNVVEDGASSQYSYFIGATSSSANSDTQPIGLVSYNDSGSRYIATILGDRNGALVLRPGASGGSIAFQDSASASNNAYVNSTAFTMAVPVILKNYTVATLPSCVAGLKGALAYVTDATAPTYNGALTGGGTNGVPVACSGTAWSSH